MPAIYHITHLGNLPGILASGGLYCDRAVAAMGGGVTSLAHSHIKARRARTMVPKGARGTLADYVPFYFGPRSPMLYAIHRGGVDGYNGGQEPVLHLVAQAEQIANAGLTFTFTDGHAVMLLSEFYDDLADIHHVNLPLMQARYWFDTDAQPDRKRRRQAEFLVHEFLPWTFIEEIGVKTTKIKTAVEACLQHTDHAPPVIVRAGWYY